MAKTKPDPLPVCARDRVSVPGALTLMLTTAGRDALDGVDDRPGVGVEKLVVRGLKSGCWESHGLDR